MHSDQESESGEASGMSVAESEPSAIDGDVVIKEAKYRRLLSISGTRFIARTRNLRIFHRRLQPIKNALVEMGLDVVANSLDGKFEATVSALYTILCPISDLSQTLQTPELNLLGAQHHLDLLSSQLRVLRTEDAYNKLISSTSSAQSTSELPETHSVDCEGNV